MPINKKGFVLPYVVILGIAVFVLATAMLSLVNVSAARDKNSFEYAQAYSNARSAISFAQGVLKNDAQTGGPRSFYLTGALDANKRMTFTCVYDTVPANTGTVYAVCAFTPATGAVAVTGYIKTPTYSQSRTIQYLTTYVQGGELDLDSYTEISFDTSSISQSLTKITSDASASTSPISVYTDLLIIGDEEDISFSQNRNYSVTLSPLSGGGFVPVIVQTTLTVRLLKNNGSLHSSFTVDPGHYHFTAGQKISSSSAWGAPPEGDDGSEHYASYGFAGGGFK